MSAHFIDTKVFLKYNKKVKFMWILFESAREMCRSGHNGADSKSRLLSGIFPPENL